MNFAIPAHVVRAAAERYDRECLFREHYDPNLILVADPDEDSDCTRALVVETQLCESEDEYLECVWGDDDE